MHWVRRSKHILCVPNEEWIANRTNKEKKKREKWGTEFIHSIDKHAIKSICRIHSIWLLPLQFCYKTCKLISQPNNSRTQTDYIYDVLHCTTTTTTTDRIRFSFTFINCIARANTKRKERKKVYRNIVLYWCLNKQLNRQPTLATKL